jgi:hypothetical protein
VKKPKMLGDHHHLAVLLPSPQSGEGMEEGEVED